MQAQQQAEEIKKRLDNIEVSGQAEAGKIKVTATGNKKIKTISIDPDLLKTAEGEELEELLVTALNRALEAAENTSQSEMQAAAQNMLGGLGNLFGS